MGFSGGCPRGQQDESAGWRIQQDEFGILGWVILLKQDLGGVLSPEYDQISSQTAWPQTSMPLFNPGMTRVTLIAA
jgi:hypothetical protein